MEKNYLTRRKLVNIIRYICNHKLLVVITIDHDCSFQSNRYCEKYIGYITAFDVESYEDAQIKLQIKINDVIREIWLTNDYYRIKPDVNNKIIYERSNGDGTYSRISIEIKREEIS